jgi:hypothetical protein
MESKQQKEKDAYEALKQFKGKQVIANIEKVSASGMTRKMKFYFIDGKNDRLENVTSELCDLLDYKLDKNYCMVVGGCGMDMVFSVLSNLNYKMAELDNYKKKPNELVYDNYFIEAERYQLI